MKRRNNWWPRRVEVKLTSKPAIPQPVNRSALRLALGKFYFTTRRHLHWHLSSARYATTRSGNNLPYLHFSHQTPMLRALSGVDMQLQRNKMASLEIAAACIDGLILKPGETFSFWRLVGKPTARRGFKTGLVLRNGTIQQDIGGGLCQMTNLIYWMTIHTDLQVTERWRHGFDVFPDAGRSQPFASGATCSYNYVDLQVRNPTINIYQLSLWCEEDWLKGAWRCDTAQRHHFEVFEKAAAIRQEWWGGYTRHNELWRRGKDVESGRQLDDEFITENHAIMMYEPLLAKPVQAP